MSVILLSVCGILALAYVALMLAYTAGWQRQPSFILPPGYKPSVAISVIIPARNEAANIGACIEAILSQQYPPELMEIVVVNDHSEDETASIARGYAGVRCIDLADHLPPDATIVAYKKAALAAGIAQSTGSLIVTTDADCTAPPLWLMHIAAIYEQQSPAMIVAPVRFKAADTILAQFQLTDLMSMQGITAATHYLRLGYMSNGANLAFSKAAYQRVNGYEGIDHMASGDDMLLMMKMATSLPQGIAYLKARNAVVSTPPQPDWRSFFSQRIRWASKSGKYDDRKLTAVLLLVYLFNLSFAALTVAACFDVHYVWVALALLAIKIAAEVLFLIPVARFFDEERVLRYFVVLQPLHIAYIIIAGFLGLIGTYTWKGRSVK
jgi:cellulose synthase/poly-beta-1,6-N-acetylglucosamine synthase-like glycosyltransferase